MKPYSVITIASFELLNRLPIARFVLNLLFFILKSVIIAKCISKNILVENNIQKDMTFVLLLSKQIRNCLINFSCQIQKQENYCGTYAFIYLNENCYLLNCKFLIY